MRIWLTGGSGLLGTAFQSLVSDDQLIVASRDELRTEDPDHIVRAVAAIGPDVVLNCAAHTDVEGAESAPETDFATNAMLPSILADACRRNNALLVHFSSTGCYGARKTEPYTEADPLQPTTIHHRSKAAGEAFITGSGCDHIIFRTGWLYGGRPGLKKNFVWNRLIEASYKAEITSDATQIGCPTHVDDLAGAVMRLLGRNHLRGIFNLTAKGNTSRYGYVREIVAASGLRCQVSPGPAFARRAAVSPNESSVNARLAALSLDSMPIWQESLRKYVNKILLSEEWKHHSR